MDKNRLKNKLKIGILFFGFSLLLWSCVYDDFKENEENIEQINSLDNSIIEKITYDELPEEFINKYLNYVNKSENSFLSKKSGKVVFEKRIKQKITKVISSNGIITYNVIPIKNKTVFYRNYNKNDDDDESTENECNTEPDHSVISMNIGSDGTQTGLYQTNFYFTNGQALNNGIDTNSRFSFYTNTVNLGLGNTFHNSGNSTGGSSTTKCIKKKGKGGAGIGVFFENVWDKIKRIFKSRAQVMPGGCLTSTSEASDEINGDIVLIDDDILYDFNIPIEEDDLEPSSLNRDTPEAFDCACDNDSPYGIAAYLKLQNAYSSIIFDEEQVELRTSICDFVKNNNYSEEAINWANGQIELETLTKNIPWKASTGTIANSKYTHTHFDGSRGYYKLEDGSIIVNSSSEQALTKTGDLRDKYNEFNPNDKYYYIKLAGSNQWAEMLFNPDNLADGLENLFRLGAIELGKSIGRYVLPIEDIKIIIDGKDFDGAEVSRLKAAGFLLLAIVPGSKALKVVGNVSDALFVAVKIGKSTLVVDTVRTGLKVVTDNNIIKFLSKTGNEIARVVNGVMSFKYTGFGGTIITNANKTTTLIGKWENQLENIWKTGLAKHGKNTGGLNILGEPFGSNVADIWANNKKWLDRAISRGDNIRVTANPLDINNVFHRLDNVDINAFSNINNLKTYLLNLDPTLVADLGYYGREIRHLFQNGYNFNSTLNQFVK